MFNVNVKIINVSLKFLSANKKSKILHKSDIPTQFPKLFKSALWYCFNIKLLKFFSAIFFLFAFLSFYMKHVFMLSILFKSHLIRHSGTGRAFKDTQRALKHLRHSKSTLALGHSESTHRVLGHLKGTLALGGHLGTQRALRHVGSQALGHLEHLGTWALGHSRHSGTRGTLFSRLMLLLLTFNG